MRKLAPLRSAAGALATRMRSLAQDEGGISAVEFGMISPALFVLLFGALDVGHTLYVQSVLHGAVQKSARDSTLQSATGTSSVRRAALDQAVRTQLMPLHGSAQLTFTRRFYRTFTDAAAAVSEVFTDTNANGTCDAGEPYIDANNNGSWDADGGDAVGNAGARDNVIYTVTMEYPRLFPIHAFIGGSSTTRARSSTVLSNQPYGDQATYAAPTTGNCPA